MTAIVLMALSTCSVLMFPLMAQPLSLGLSMMISTLFLFMSSAMLISSSYAYILFLFFVGGLLVMFATELSGRPKLLSYQSME